jgi:nucleoside-diphosphate-sugar epimerase
VYQPSKDIHIETESLNANSNSTYINIKILCEKLVQNSFEKYAIVRPSKVYGPYNHICRESYFYKRLINNEQMVLINDPILHFTFVIDLVEGILRLAKKEPIGIFNVAGKEPMRLSLFIEIMAKKMNISPLIIWDIDSDAPMTKLQTCVLSNMKMYEVCGWQPHYTIAEGMDFTLQYLRGE